MGSYITRDAETISESRNYNPEDSMGLRARVSWWIHGYAAIEYIYEMMMLVVVPLMAFGVINNVTAFIILVVLAAFFNFFFLLLEWFFLGTTFTTRGHTELVRSTTVGAEGNRNATLSLTETKPPDYATKITRDIEFHVDQRHVLRGFIYWSLLAMYAGAFFGFEGFNNHPWPFVYDYQSANNAVLMKFLYAFAVCIAGIQLHDMMDTLPCFLRTTMMMMNIEMRKVWTAVDPSRADYSLPAKDEMTRRTDMTHRVIGADYGHF